MGYLRPTAIIVSASYGTPPWIEMAHAEAMRIHAARELTHLVTEVLPPAVNGEQSFLVGWDGSKEGWEASDEGDACRAEFVEWLRSQAYEDGSSPFNWVEVQYGGDDREAFVLSHADSEEVAT